MLDPCSWGHGGIRAGPMQLGARGGGGGGTSAGPTQVGGGHGGIRVGQYGPIIVGMVPGGVVQENCLCRRTSDGLDCVRWGLGSTTWRVPGGVTQWTSRPAWGWQSQKSQGRQSWST